MKLPKLGTLGPYGGGILLFTIVFGIAAFQLYVMKKKQQ